MQKTILSVVFFLILASILKLNAQYDASQTSFKRCFVGSSLFMLGNLDSYESPDFLQLNLGYRMTPKDVVSFELKTWKYYKPLGLPYGKSFNAQEEKFPGYIRERGFALAYQHFWWKGLYTGVHVMSAWQNFVNNDGNTIDDGFQIFNTYRLGYHIKLFKGRFFIEPSIAVTHRPYHTKMPESFKQLDDRHSKFFFGEPGFHFGYNF
jgi:flavodoxin